MARSGGGRRGAVRGGLWGMEMGGWPAVLQGWGVGREHHRKAQMRGQKGALSTGGAGGNGELGVVRKKGLH